MICGTATGHQSFFILSLQAGFFSCERYWEWPRRKQAVSGVSRRSDICVWTGNGWQLEDAPEYERNIGFWILGLAAIQIVGVRLHGSQTASIRASNWHQSGNSSSKQLILVHFRTNRTRITCPRLRPVGQYHDRNSCRCFEHGHRMGGWSGAWIGLS